MPVASSDTELRADDNSAGHAAMVLAMVGEGPLIIEKQRHVLSLDCFARIKGFLRIARFDVVRGRSMGAVKPENYLIPDAYIRQLLWLKRIDAILSRFDEPRCHAGRCFFLHSSFAML